jgi:hypothetical protein
VENKRWYIFYFFLIIFFTFNIVFFSVHPSTILQVLKLPGSEQEWNSSYQTVLESLGGQEGMAGMVWNSLQFVGAPGSQEEWNSIVKKVGDSLVFFKMFLLEN